MTAPGYAILDWHADERGLTIVVINPLRLVGEFTLLAGREDPDHELRGLWEYACPLPPHGPGGSATLGYPRDQAAIVTLNALLAEHPVIPHAVNLRYYERQTP